MEYRISYPTVSNMGDLLNKDMLEAVFGINVKKASTNNCNMVAIGSHLNSLLNSPGLKISPKQKIIRRFKKVYVWGTGFINYSSFDAPFSFHNVEILSLRGKLTLSRVEKILGRSLDIPLGDGGLLASKWIGYGQEKKHRVGIIPHYKEKDSPLLREMLDFYDDSFLVDLGKEPIDVVREIASCEVVLSSSLHGLIIADSFHIPNAHILLYPFGEKMLGDGYKFSDYYSAFDLLDKPVDCSDRRKWPLVTDIIDSYAVDRSRVELAKSQIYEVFPR